MELKIWLGGRKTLPINLDGMDSSPMELFLGLRPCIRIDEFIRGGKGMTENF